MDCYTGSQKLLEGTEFLSYETFDIKPTEDVIIICLYSERWEISFTLVSEIKRERSKVKCGEAI